jgi:protein SCO1/2
MATPTSKIFYAASALVVGVAVFVGVFLLATGQFSTAKTVGGPFKLIGDDGQPISDATFKGKPYLIYFGYTHCPDVCPTTLFELSEVMKALGKNANHTAVLFVTIDPERDTAAVMKDYLSNFDRHLMGATGDPKTVRAVEKEFNVFAQKVPAKDGDYSMNHSSEIYLMDKQGHFVEAFDLKRKPKVSAAELRKYM